MSIAGADPRRNRLFQLASPSAFAALERHLELVSFDLRDSVYVANTPVTRVYFPLSGALDLVRVLGDGASVSTAMVGREGFIGHPVVLGVERMPDEVVCKLPSTCAAVAVDRFREHAAGHLEWRALLRRYTAALFNIVGQTAACNRLHTVEKRVARYILLEHDRAEGDEFPITHEFFAEMLGVRRATITETFAALEDRDLIRTARGRLRVVDRAGLEATACECYRIMWDEVERVFAS